MAARKLPGFGPDDLKDLGMSPAVQRTFGEAMTADRQRKLQALWSHDQYEIRVKDRDGKLRPLGELSGGRRVGVLLELLLRGDDRRPLVIDQPEDELDNASLFQTILPALRGLKGRRQVVFATHNANIVVNGDADMVIALEADKSHGRIACSGAIEDPEVRDAIVSTLDGGVEAFRLRRTKYGF